MNNKEKKRVFAQRARISTKQEDKDKLSIGRFADRNKVYVSKKKIELQKREKEFKSKYERSKELNSGDGSSDKVSNIYSQYQDNDPLSRFATGDSNKYSELSRKLNKQSKKKVDYKKEDEDGDSSNNSGNSSNNSGNSINNSNSDSKINSSNKIDNSNNDSSSGDGGAKIDDRETNFSIQKQFQLAKQQYQKEKKEKEEMYRQIEEKKEITKRQIQQKKKEKFAVLLKKTKKGQPIMSNQINKLLSKLQKDEQK